MREHFDPSLEDRKNKQDSTIEAIGIFFGTEARELETNLLRIDDICAHTIEKFEGSYELFNVNPITYAKTNSMLKNTKNAQTKIYHYITILSHCNIPLPWRK